MTAERKTVTRRHLLMTSFVFVLRYVDSHFWRSEDAAVATPHHLPEGQCFLGHSGRPAWPGAASQVEFEG